MKLIDADELVKRLTIDKNTDIYQIIENTPAIKIEDLKQKLKEMGYNVIKIPKREKFLPCVCGCNRRTTWFSSNNINKYIYECQKCGLSASGKTEKEARHNWNIMIKNRQEKLNV